MEVLKSLLPMVLAVIFVWCAAIFAAMAIKQKKNRLVGGIGALMIELVSFTIWIPSLNDLFDQIALLPQTRSVAMLIAIVVILCGTTIATIWEVKKKET